MVVYSKFDGSVRIHAALVLLTKRIMPSVPMSVIPAGEPPMTERKRGSLSCNARVRSSTRLSSSSWPLRRFCSDCRRRVMSRMTP
ncbi:MAG: hypothetical protein O3A85_12330 [Proteobacteria bacterium]|nr:hypothetical protein [Pseudomonadota bacterium]